MPGSRQAWLAVLGPDTPPTGEQRTPGHLSQNQVAQTMAALLGLTYPAPAKPDQPAKLFSQRAPAAGDYWMRSRELPTD